MMYCAAVMFVQLFNKIMRIGNNKFHSVARLDKECEVKQLCQRITITADSNACVTDAHFIRFSYDRSWKIHLDLP